ncbi:hypothetical protein B0T20DRAFT_89822 [Sordaria brevicollis]|uniref:Uncharacterized protein n=1 Tax=Sordaria brevicollis TaxID=83679 RepID=A0AAE0NW86_SORBR|nr:hypothetical protein B0T20DRAFT_89822 [Sordaria brevicollis]
MHFQGEIGLFGLYRCFWDGDWSFSGCWLVFCCSLIALHGCLRRTTYPSKGGWSLSASPNGVFFLFSHFAVFAFFRVFCRSWGSPIVAQGIGGFGLPDAEFFMCDTYPQRDLSGRS